MIAKRCPDAYCDENNILRGAKTQGVSKKYEGSYKDASKKEQNQRRWFGVDNRYICWKLKSQKSNTNINI